MERIARISFLPNVVKETEVVGDNTGKRIIAINTFKMHARTSLQIMINIKLCHD